MSCRKHIFGFGLLATMAVTAPVYAQSTASAAPNIATDFPVCAKALDADLARQKYIAGRQDYEEGSYDSALRRFKDAYAQDCTKPEVLLIVSATYEKKGDRPSALASLETYLQRAGSNPPDLGTTQTKIDNLKKQIASQPPPSTTSTSTTTTTQPSDVQEHTIYPWLLVGAGVAAVAVGIVIIAIAPSLPSNCVVGTNKCSLRTDSVTKLPVENESQLADDKTTAGRSQGFPIVGGIVAGVGGAMILGGVLWHFLEPTGAKGEKSATLTPSVSPSFAGMTFGSKF